MRFPYFRLEVRLVRWPSCNNECRYHVCARPSKMKAGLPPESTMYVVTFSGVTSGGIVTSGTIC